MGQEPVQVEVVEDPDATTPRVELLLLGAGSRWDPPGQEGRSAVALIAPPRAQPQVEVTVAREHAWLVAECVGAPSGARDCVQGTTSILLGSAWVDGSADAGARRYWVDQLLLDTRGEDLAREALLALLYEAHPYGHAPLGRHGALPALTALQVQAFFPSQVRRSTVLARIVAADPAAAAPVAERLAEALIALPAGLPPDAAMKGPPPAAPILAVGAAVGPQAHLAVGVALPRRATEVTRARLDPDWTASVLALSRCADALFADSDLVQHPMAQAPDGWHATLRTPAHPALVWTTTASPDRVVALLGELAEPRSDATSPGCEGVADEVRGLLAPERLGVVVLWPRGIEDPWPQIVEGGPWTTLVRLPDSPEELLR